MPMSRPQFDEVGRYYDRSRTYAYRANGPVESISISGTGGAIA
jgi:hypothetical protein